MVNLHGDDGLAGGSLGIDVVLGADADVRELAEAAELLRREILQLDVEDVASRPAGAPPPGVRSAEVVAVGSLIVQIVESDAFEAVVKAVLAWLRRRRGHRVRLDFRGDVLELTGALSGEEAQRCEGWLGRRTAGGVPSSGSRHALIVANDLYEDPGLRQLRAPAHDAEALAEVLADPAIGGFQVRTLMNQPAHLINEAVEDFFADRHRDDLLLLHFSSHGLKDEAGELHFAAGNTKLGRLGATAVAAEFVNHRMTRSRSQRIVVLLDCCYAGAFDRSLIARAGTDVGIEEHFGGRGRAVITASSAVEYAFEDGQLTDVSGAGQSVFTRALVEGLATGDADRDQDGYVGLDELYEYVYDRVREVTPHQTPSKWTFAVEGDLYIARRSRPVTTAAPLPPVLQESVDHPLAQVRLGAVHELASLLASRHAGRALAARQTLERLADDDSRKVSAAAAEALAAQIPPSAQTASSPAIAAPTFTPPVPTAARVTVPPARRPRSAETLEPVATPVLAEHGLPATLEIDVPPGIGKWRPLVQWLLASPQLTLLFCLSVVSLFVAVLSWLAIVATGKLPATMASFQVLTLRYRERVYAYAKGLVAEPPPFAWSGTDVDPGDYDPVRVSVQPAADGRGRLSTFTRGLILIRYGIAILVWTTVALLVWSAGLVAVLATGQWPPELSDRLVDHRRWRLQVSANARLLTDDSPHLRPRSRA